MGNAVNQATSLAGVKLFPGGPYADRGLGDAAMKASAPLQAEGQTLMGQGQANIPFLMSMLSGTGTTAGAGGGTTKTDSFGQPIGGTTGAYGLSPVFQEQLNALSAPINAARKTALQAAKASMSARGLGGAPGAEKALEQTINAAAEADLTGAHNQVMQAQQTSFQTALQDALNMIGLGGNMVQGNVNTLENQAQAATARTNQAHADLFSAIGAGFAGANALGGRSATAPSAGGNTWNPATSTWQSGGQNVNFGPASPGMNLGSTGINSPLDLWSNLGSGPTFVNPATGKNVSGGQ